MIMAALLLVMGLGSCTKYEYIDTGLSYGVHDCSMWDYFHKDSYNWDSTILMIERAGLRSLFDGTGEYKQITFFGLTNLSIERQIQNHNKKLKPTDADYWRGVNDIPVALCRDMLMKLVAPFRFMREDVPVGQRLQQPENGVTVWVEKGGMVCPCLKGNLFVWTMQQAYNKVDNTGVIELFIVTHNSTSANSNQIASTDIQTNNGVVHSLNYDFTYDKL